MPQSPTDGINLLAVHPGEFLTMRYHPARLLLPLVRFICRTALRAVITGLIFTICLTATLSYLGLPLPNPYELLNRLESVSQLAEILS